MTLSKQYIRAKVAGIAGRMAALCVLLASLTGCESIFDDQSDCPRGVALRFVYDYNMERADAFPQQVDCITVYVYDRNGNFVMKQTETSDVLAAEGYRMTLPLDAGTYEFIALGGTADNQSTFHVNEPAGRAGDGSLAIRLPLDAQRRSDAMLHDLFYGNLAGVTLLPDDYQEHTIYLIKDTNSIQVTLQEIDAPYTVDVDDYDFTIEADNDLLDSDNNTVSNGGVFYRAHSLENRVAGFVDMAGNTVQEDHTMNVQVATSEFSVSRLMTQNSEKTYIVVRKKDSGDQLLRVPMIQYMTMLRHNSHSWIQNDQEFLDRQSTWSFIFFLQSGKWINTRVAVNNWILRFNHATV